MWGVPKGDARPATQQSYLFSIAGPQPGQRQEGQGNPPALTGSDANSYLQRETSGLSQQDSERKEKRELTVAWTLTFQAERPSLLCRVCP